MLWSAFLMGFVGSLHCAGMCGPLTLLLPTDKRKYPAFITGRVLYNLGRIFTYALLGLIIGFIGQNTALFFSKSLLSVTLGILILLGVLLSGVYFQNNFLYAKINLFTSKLKTGFRNNFNRNYFVGQFFFGILNGLLPCGLVYAALAGSFIQLDELRGTLFMALFGLGTVPMMLSISLGSGWFKRKFGGQVKRIIPITYAALALWLIVRGLYTQDPNFHQHPMQTIVECFVPH